MEAVLLDFLQSSFRSIWSLELLIFLRQHRGEVFTADALVRELRGSTPVIVQSLGMLQAAGLVAAGEDGRVGYAPASPEIDRLAQAAESAYNDKPGAVRRAILTGPVDTLQTFADAFRLKKDPP